MIFQVIIEGEENRATGVEYERHDETYIVKATKEVILSAGSIQSPRILMHSGIGPRKHLEEIGVSDMILIICFE